MPKNILVADDNPSIRSLICRLVESEGFAVCAEAANGIEAIEMAHKFQPNLILIDLTMPLMNGAEAATILKKQLPHIPIILFTMYEDSLNAMLASEIGCRQGHQKGRGNWKTGGFDARSAWSAAEGYWRNRPANESRKSTKTP